MNKEQRRVIWTHLTPAAILAFLALTVARDAFDSQQVVMACIAAVIFVYVTVMHYRDAGRSN